MKLEIIEPIYTNRFRYLLILLNFTLYVTIILLLVLFIKNPTAIIVTLPLLGFLQFTLVQNKIIDKYNVVDSITFKENSLTFSGCNIAYVDIKEIKIKGEFGISFGPYSYTSYQFKINNNSKKIIHVKSSIIDNKKWFKKNDLISALNKHKVNWSMY